MSGARPAATATIREGLLMGWGGTAPSRASIVHVTRPGDVEDAIARRAGVLTAGGVPPYGPRRNPGIAARGLGRSYGDAAQCAGGIVLDMTGLDRVLELDLAAGRVRVEAGASLEFLMRELLPQGWFVPVTPGTRHVTVGGALAADIHGKNHHRDGSFASFVRGCTLVTPRGTVECGPDRSTDVFWATAGGMGLTGVVTDLVLDLLPVETAFMRVDTERAPDLDRCMAMMDEGDAGYRYSVAWIDCLAEGKSLGRSVLTRANHARRDELPSRAGSDPLAFDPSTRVRVPLTPPLSLLRPVTVAAFNELWFRKAPRRRIGGIEPITGFFHPLDAVGGWNRLYGPRGFLQYQFAVPPAGAEAVRVALERLSKARVASFLAVLKRFGPADPGPLSFPLQGWTLALDVPVGSDGLVELLDGLDDLVAEAGGRIYLAKDGRLRPDLVATMYPRLSEWQEVRHRLDPDGVLSTDLSRRLKLA